MRLNTIKPAAGARTARTRVGRGIGSGLGKTAGRGHKGSYARTGKGKIKPGFEGGQMPLQRRLPKIGFVSQMVGMTAEVRLHELERVKAEVVDLASLKGAGIVSREAEKAKIIASGKVTRAVKVRGIKVTPGARKAIEAAGGSIEE